jgi:hypothetical protein
MIEDAPAVPLVANAGGPYACYTDEPLELDGSKSSGPAGFTFSWAVLPPPARLRDDATAKPRALFEVEGDYEATLTITMTPNSKQAKAAIKVQRRKDAPPITSDDDWWHDKFLDARRNALSAVRSSADKWQALLGTILGLFATVAFVTGPTTLDKLPPRRAGATVVLVVFAFGLALAGLLSAVAAGQAAPKVEENLDGARYRDKTLVE